MADSILEMIRKRLPLGAQIGYGWLKYQIKPRPLWDDKEFIRYSRWLEKTQWWSREQLEELQLEKLRALVQHAYENVPYYRRVFDRCGVRPADVVTLDDLQKLPLLTKQDVRDNLEDLVAQNVDRTSLCYRTTSGSTGNPLGVYQDKHTSYLHELSLVYRQRNWAGCRLGDRFVTLRGDVLPESGVKGRRTWWSYNPGHNQLVLSSYDMTEENLFGYVQKIEEFRPKFIHALPSSIEILARFMQRNAINITTVKAVFIGGETVYPEQRRFIESQFGCRIFARYGMTEKAADAVECEQHEGYHVGMEYGAFELLDQRDEPIKGPGTPGRVVGTGFDTFCMPLIRYVTDDIAEYAPSTCSCKRQSTLIQDFKGRLQELIVSKCGHAVPLSATFGGFHGPIVSKIRELKFLQEREGELVVQIAKAPGFSEAEVAREFLDETYHRLGREKFSVRIVFVDYVPRTGRGKLGLLEQKLPIKIEYLDQFGSETGGAGAGC
jgi:phenylacetate-CoA ligase